MVMQEMQLPDLISKTSFNEYKIELSKNEYQLPNLESKISNLPELQVINEINCINIQDSVIETIKYQDISEQNCFFLNP